MLTLTKMLVYFQFRRCGYYANGLIEAENLDTAGKALWSEHVKTFKWSKENFISEDANTLILQLKNKDPEIRRVAAKTLGENGEDEAKVVAALILGLQDKDAFVRRFSAQSLGNLKTKSKDAIPALATLLNNIEEKKENL